MAYAVYDFTESLDRVAINQSSVKRVVAAWGGSSEGYDDWSGGFLMEMQDGQYAYLSGWCDSTGWGCQDGAEVAYFETEPTTASLAEEDWDRDPADLTLTLAIP